MPPLPRDAVTPGERPPADRDARPRAGAEDHAPHEPGPRASPVHGLRDREAVRVVLDAHRPAERASEVLGERAAVEPGRVRAPHQSGRRREAAGDADPDGALPPDSLLDLPHEARRQREAPLVIVPRRRRAEAGQRLARRRQGRGLDLRAAPVEPDQHGSSPPPASNATTRSVSSCHGAARTPCTASKRPQSSLEFGGLRAGVG